MVGPRVMSRHKATSRVPGLVLAASLSAACGRAHGEQLTLAGSTSLQPISERWADAYRAGKPGLAIMVQGGGSTAGVRAARAGAAQIGLSSRSLTEQESRGARVVEVARDGIALVVHPENPLRSLTLPQLRSLYAGTVRSWSAVGGKPAAISAITREEGSGTRAAFEALVMQDAPIAVRTLVQDSAGAVRQMVSSDPQAIGYISVGLVDGSVVALRLDGVAPTEAAIDAGEYPLVRPFLFVLPERKHERADDFVAWVLGPEGGALARREGLLPPKKQEFRANR